MPKSVMRGLDPRIQMHASVVKPYALDSRIKSGYDGPLVGACNPSKSLTSPAHERGKRPKSVMRGLDPRIQMHASVVKLHAWIAGSSPAMTAH